MESCLQKEGGMPVISFYGSWENYTKYCFSDHSLRKPPQQSKRGVSNSKERINYLVLYSKVYYFKGKRVLILAPLITLENWVNEFRKWHVDGFSSILGQVFNFSGIFFLKKKKVNTIE